MALALKIFLFGAMAGPAYRTNISHLGYLGKLGAMIFWILLLLRLGLGQQLGKPKWLKRSSLHHDNKLPTTNPQLDADRTALAKTNPQVDAAKLSNASPFTPQSTCLATSGCREREWIV